MLRKATSHEIIRSALFDINNQYDNQIDDIDTSLLVESALLIAFESHKSEQKEVLQNIAHSVCNFALTIERAKIESNEICALMFAYDDTEQDEESDDEPEADTAPVEQKPTFDPEALKKIAGTSMTVEDNGDIRFRFKRQ
jgi:hypothetical protein